MQENILNFAISSSFIDDDALSLVTAVISKVKSGEIPANISCVISTREMGESPGTDRRLTVVQNLMWKDTPLVCVSAGRSGRLRDSSEASKNAYDQKILEEIYRLAERLPDLAVFLGDMIIRGKQWCEKIPSLNLHPDLPLSHGGTEGIYWNVIGNWAMRRRQEGGAMMHLISPSLDAGQTVSYMRFPLTNILGTLPEDTKKLEILIQKQTGLKNRPTHPFFIQARRKEYSYEEPLVLHTLKSIATGRVLIREGKVFNQTGEQINGLDLTSEIVGSPVICRR